MTSAALYLSLPDADLPLIRTAVQQSPHRFNEWEAALPEDRKACLDKAWDAIVRCLGNGTLEPAGNADLARMIFGDDSMGLRGPFQFLGTLAAARVQILAEAATGVTDELFAERYAKLKRTFWGFDISDYEGFHSPEDLEYSLEHFHDLCSFFKQSADRSLGVVVLVTG